MPRTKKVQEQVTNQSPPIQIKDVENRWRTLFNASNGGVGSNINNFLMNSGSFFVNDPYLLNQRIKSLRSRPAFLERDKIENALVSPGENEMVLRNATNGMMYMAYPMYRMQMLYEGILKYRDYVQPLYVDKDDMSKPRFMNDWKFVDMWQKKLNAKKQFRRITAQVVAEGKRAYYLRQSFSKESVNYVYFEELPSDWYKIIKHSTDSYEVVAFNFAYFWEAGTSLGQFPPIFAKYYEELMGSTIVDKNGNKYIDMANTPDDVVVEYNREKLQWFYWKELPANQCFVFSFTESDDFQISPFVSLLLMAQDLSSYALLQQQLLAVPLYSIILGELPLSEKNKGGSVLDDYALSPEAVNVFENKVNSKMPPGTSYAMVPSQKNLLYNFQEVPNADGIYNKGLQQLINTSGASTLMTTTEKPSVAQVAAGKIIETRFIDRIYEQFAWAVNIILRDMYDDGNLNYKWHYRIDGDAFSEEDEKRSLKDALNFGQIELLPKYLSKFDMSLYDAITVSDWVDSTGIYDKFKPLVSTYTASTTEESKNGRPPADENNIENDSTANSIDAGTNTADMKFSISCENCGEEMEVAIDEL